MHGASSLEKALMLGKTEGRRRRGWQRMRWLDGITDSMEWVWAGSGRWWRAGKPGVLESMGSQRVRHDWATDSNSMEAKSEDLPSASWRCRRASVIPAQIWAGLRPRKNQYFILSLKVGKGPTIEFKAIKQNYLLLFHGRVSLLFRSWIDWMRPTHIREGNILYSDYQFLFFFPSFFSQITQHVRS